MEHETGPQGADAGETERALRQRLAFYEGFDGIINENVRRSAELLRDAEQQHAAALIAAASARTEQERLFDDLAVEIEAVSSRLAALAQRVAQARASLDPSNPGTASSPQALFAIDPAASASAPDPAIGAGETQIVLHGIDDLATAQAIRFRIAGIPGVTTAEPKEFTGGLLRLAVHSGRTLALDELRRSVSPLSLVEIDGGPGVIALRVEGAGTW
jgi:hypothetical protein